MKIQDIKKKAKKLGIKSSRMNKTDLIKVIQRAEGNPECFGNDMTNCDQLQCCWRDDCFKKK